MGQQQLLLVILVTIIVGIATVVAINIFGTSAEQANQDAVRQDLAQIGTAAQGWVIKPALLGGGNNEFDDIDFRKFTFPGQIDASNPLVASNLNGYYVISDRGNDSFKVTAYLASSDDYTGTSAAGDWFEIVVERGEMFMSAVVNEPAVEEEVVE